MKRVWFGVGLGGVGALALVLTSVERRLDPWMWTLGLRLGQTLAPVVEFTGDQDAVDWEALEREVAAADVPEAEPSDQHAKGTKPKPKPNKPQGGALFVSAERVLALSKHAQVPASRYVPASGKRPAGLQVAGVGGLGIGAKDGDVLTRVAGADVRSSAAVISIVLQARARKARSISGEFWRGQERWQIVVEMPYPELPQAAKPGSEAKLPSPAPSPPPTTNGARAASSAPSSPKAPRKP